MKKKSARELEFISLEERPQPRLKFVGVDLELLSGDRFIVRVELEQLAGLTHVGVVEAKGPEMERIRCAGIAAAKALRSAIGADFAKLQFLDLTAIKVFDTPAVAVSLAAHVGDEVQSLVGFCVVEDDLPVRAAALAVLNSVNRFLGAVVINSGDFHWARPRK